MLAFGINLVLNALWSALYFGLEQPLLAFFDIGLILVSIIYMIIITWEIDRKAALMLVPYLLWVNFAAVLNLLSI
jgi:tryptophan-rich sensory protein